MMAVVIFSVLSLIVTLPNCYGADTSKVVEKLREGIEHLDAANATLIKLVAEMQTAQKDISGGAGQLGQVGTAMSNGPLQALYTALKGLLDTLTGLLNEAVISVNPDNVVSLISSVATNFLKAAQRVLNFVTTTLQGSATEVTGGVNNLIEGALAIPNNIILNFIKLLADLTNVAGGISEAKRMAFVN